MRKSVLFIVIIAIAACVLLLISQHKLKPPISTEQTPAEAVKVQPANPPQVPLPGGGNLAAGNGVKSESNSITTVGNQTVQEIIAEENSKSQDFYGKVVDQYGQPIIDADVSGILIIKTEDGFEPKTFTIKTDAEGFFQIVGIQGSDLNVKVKKDGYRIGEHGEGYQGPVGGKSSPSNRATFTMWKLKGPEPLTSTSIDSSISHDGSMSVFDIATGKASPTGDLRVTLSQSPLEVKTGREKFNWKVSVEILNGGLAEEKDPYPYLAPTDGYQPSFEFSVSSNASDWSPNLKKSFYIKNRLGQYGIMQFNIYPGQSPTKLEANFTINPSGSQNLEPNFSN